MYINLFTFSMATVFFISSIIIAYKYGRKTAAQEIIKYLDEVRQRFGLEKKRNGLPDFKFTPPSPPIIKEPIFPKDRYKIGWK